MPICEWVLDTWLLEIGQDVRDPRSLEALALLQEIKSRHRIAVDYGRKILREYFDHASGDSHVGQWLRVVVTRSDKVMWRTGNIPSRHRQELREELRFDASDLVFVGVALEGSDRLIVSQESDYSPEVKAYLQDQMGIRVLSVREALERARDC